MIRYTFAFSFSFLFHLPLLILLLKSGDKSLKPPLKEKEITIDHITIEKKKERVKEKEFSVREAALSTRKTKLKKKKKVLRRKNLHGKERGIGEVRRKINNVENAYKTYTSKNLEIGKKTGDSVKKQEKVQSRKGITSAVLERKDGYKTANGVKYSKVYIKKYLHLIRQILQKNLSYPTIAKKMGWEGICVIQFTLTPEGKIENIKVVKSSGYKTLDRNAVTAIIKSASEFPKPKERITLEVPIIYRLR